MDPVLAFIYESPDPQRMIMLHLHEWLTGFPGVHARLRYKIPFYDRNSWICYLNPVRFQQVELVFTRAHELSNEQGLLEFRGRKQVAGMIISDVKEIPQRALEEILHEALLVDEEIPYRVGKRKRKW